MNSKLLGSDICLPAYEAGPFKSARAFSKIHNSTNDKVPTGRRRDFSDEHEAKWGNLGIINCGSHCVARTLCMEMYGVQTGSLRKQNLF